MDLLEMLNNRLVTLEKQLAVTVERYNALNTEAENLHNAALTLNGRVNEVKALIAEIKSASGDSNVESPAADKQSV